MIVLKLHFLWPLLALSKKTSISCYITLTQILPGPLTSPLLSLSVLFYAAFTTQQEVKVWQSSHCHLFGMGHSPGTHRILYILSSQDLHMTTWQCLRRLKQLRVTGGYHRIHTLYGNGLSFWTGRTNATQQCQMPQKGHPFHKWQSLKVDKALCRTHSCPCEHTTQIF